MTELPLRPKQDMDIKSMGLSVRGAELSASGAILDMFKQILENVYDPDTNPGGIINIGVAENYNMLPEAADFAAKHVNELKPSAKDFSYGDGPWGSLRLREAMANHINRHFKPLKPVKACRLLFANGVTSLCEMLGFSICDEGDAILLSKPIYQSFRSDFGTKANVKCIYVDFRGIDQFSPGALEKYEEAIKDAEERGTRIRALIICHPHNPLGRCYKPETLIELMQLCSKYKIHLLVDEIYAFSVYQTDDNEAVHFQSILTLDIENHIDRNFVHFLYGMSKDMASGGLRLGCIYSHNEELLRALSVMSPFHWSSSSSERIAILMLEDQEWMDGFLALSRTKLSDSSRMTKRLLDEEGIVYYKGTNAGLFLWINLFPHLSGKHFANDGFKAGWLAEDKMSEALIKNGVFMTNGREMNAEEPGWYRLIFAQDERTIKAGIKRIMEVVKDGRA